MFGNFSTQHSMNNVRTDSVSAHVVPDGVAGGLRPLQSVRCILRGVSTATTAPSR